MKASVSSWSYRTLFDSGQFDLLSFVDEVKRLEATGLEIFPRHVDQDSPAEHLKQVVAKAGELGLEISSLIAANSFAGAAIAERAEQVERMKGWIAAAAAAGIRRMNTFTGYHGDGQDPIMEVCRVIDCYREVMPLAEDNDILLCIENHSSVARDGDSILHIIRAVGSPNLRTNPDFTNFVPGFRELGEKALETMYKETAKVAPLASNAHLKVADFNEDGEHAYVDTSRIVDILDRAGYDGHIVLEYYGRDDCVEACAKGVQLLRRYV